jgi:hypothetical protein
MEIDEIKKILPKPDVDYLISKGYQFDAHRNGDGVHVIIDNYNFPEAYQSRQASLLIILPAGYPNANPDMFWTCPDVKLINGAWPKAAEHHETYNGRSWQRWSRHSTGQWRPGIDDLQTFLASVRKEVDKGV